jgi:hypothetical protein
MKTVTVLEMGLTTIGPVIKHRLPTGVNQLNPSFIMCKSCDRRNGRVLSRRGLGKELRLRVSVECLQCLHLGGDLSTSKYLVRESLSIAIDQLGAGLA